MNFEQSTEEGSKAEKESPTIANSENFEELFEAIREAGGIQGSHKFYSAENLIERINKVRKEEDGPLSITNGTNDNERLRDKVVELAGKEISGN